MAPPGYRLGKKQLPFDAEIGKKLYAVVKRYLTTTPTLLQEGIQAQDSHSSLSEKPRRF